jgi:hypothetical protein
MCATEDNLIKVFNEKTSILHLSAPSAKDDADHFHL